MTDEAAEPGSLNPVELRAWRGLIEITPLLRQRLDQLLMADSGLSGSDYPVLVTLHERGERTVRSTELADLIGWEQSRLSHHLARMERRGLIRRSRHQADNRVAEVHLTDEGRAAFLRAAKGHSRAVRTHFADVLTVPQLEALAEIMEALKCHLDSSG
ncbi:MarR family winged helix-turn-helix transcriptional regulator [Streptosporangium sp. G11]|uniref:MarR family winged helix-turn-helix transcriptional regulator n=1 Tax=Streptosporangium sp. G11 TaxID=3436926 RepID=UPI003EBB4F14